MKKISSVLIIILFIGFILSSCNKENKNDEYSESCRYGINNNECNYQLIENSIWGFNSSNEEVDFNHFYRFYSIDQTWEHFLFIKLPLINKYLIEKRSGTFEIFGDENSLIRLSLNDSTCSGQKSLFSIFDQNERELKIIRAENLLTLSTQEESSNISKAEFQSNKNFLIQYTEIIAYSMTRLVMEAILLLITPELWVDVVTGGFSFNEGTLKQFENLYSKGFFACTSQEGLSIIESNI